MPGHFPSIDPDSLAKLRKLVRSMHEGNGRTLPMEDLVKLAGDVGLNAGITVDFEASRELVIYNAAFLVIAAATTLHVAQAAVCTLNRRL